MTSPDRALELVASRQHQRRAFNQRLAALDAAEPHGETTPFRCECGLIACGATIRLTAGEYTELRADARHFAVLAQHAVADAGRVVERRRGWARVEQAARFTSEVPSLP